MKKPRKQSKLAIVTTLFLVILTASDVCSAGQNVTYLLEQAKTQQAIDNNATAVQYFKTALLSSTDNPVTARECLQGLSSSYAELSKSFPSAAVFYDGFEGWQGLNGVSKGWIAYEAAPPGYAGGKVKYHVIDGTPSPANQGFSGTNPIKNTPLGWTDWGRGHNYIGESKDSNAYTGAICIPDNTAGIKQTIDGLAVGKTYKFSCWVEEGAGALGVDPSGGVDEKSVNVIWTSQPVVEEGTFYKDHTPKRRLVLEFEAVSDEATIFLTSANGQPVTMTAPCADVYIWEKGRKHQFLQEIDASSIYGSAGPGEDSYYKCGLYRQVDVANGSALLVKLRGFLNVPLGRPSAFFRVGVDPFGGADPYSPDVKWSKKCWNVDNAQRWVDVFASTAIYEGTVTVFIDYQIRRNGYDNTQFMSLLLQDVWVSTTDEPAAVSESIRGVAESFENVYSSFVVDELLQSSSFTDRATPSQRKWAPLCISECYRIAGNSRRANKWVKNVAASERPQGYDYAFSVAAALANDQHGHGSGLEKHNARETLKQELLAAPVDAFTAPARLHLADNLWRDGQSENALAQLAPINDSFLTPMEQIRKRLIQVEAFHSCGDDEQALETVKEISAIAENESRGFDRASANLLWFQLALSQKPVNYSRLKSLMEETALIPDLTDMQKARVDSALWFLSHLQDPEKYKTAADQAFKMAEETVEPAYKPVFYWYAFEYYLRSEHIEDAKATMQIMLENYPDAFVTTTVLRDAYENELISEPEGGEAK